MRTFQDNFIGINVEFDHKSLKEAIAEYLFYYSLIKNENIDMDLICQELGLIDCESAKNKMINL